MAWCHTDCIEKPLQICFRMMGHFIGSHPWWFLITPLIVSTGLGSGFYFLRDRTSNNIEEQFTPVDGSAKMERKYIEETFPGNSPVFSQLRLSRGGSYAAVIAADRRDILTAETLHDVLDLDFKIKNMSVQIDNRSFQYVDVCAEVMGSCVSNDIMDIIEYNANNIDTVNLTYPWHHSDFRSFPLFLSLGSVRLNTEGSMIEHAEAIQLYYYLEEDNKTLADLWLQSFINLVSNVSFPSLRVSRTPVINQLVASLSFQCIDMFFRYHTQPQCQCSGNLRNLHPLSSVYSPSPTPSPSCFLLLPVGGQYNISLRVIQVFFLIISFFSSG